MLFAPPCDPGARLVFINARFGRKYFSELVPSDRILAFRLMISVINYDLASEPRNRRPAKSFDKDWQLYLSVTEDNGMRVDPAARESLDECSAKEFTREGATAMKFRYPRPRDVK